LKLAKDDRGMIFGIGTDIVELSRVQGIYDRYGDHFAQRILMDEELELYQLSKDPVRFLAMRFAGKEATVKAMGTGSERGSRVCARLGIGSGHVSLTDDAGLVMAFAIVENAEHKA
jgi:holo-[acyl-carrier protein] synthase